MPAGGRDDIKVCLLPDGDDPDSFARKHNATDYQAYINDHEVDFIRFKTNLLLEEAGKRPYQARCIDFKHCKKHFGHSRCDCTFCIYPRMQPIAADGRKDTYRSHFKTDRQARETKFKEQQRKKEREQRMTETPAVQPSVPDTPTNEPQATDTTPDLNNNTPLPPEPTPANTYTSYIRQKATSKKYSMPKKRPGTDAYPLWRKNNVLYRKQ